MYDFLAIAVGAVSVFMIILAIYMIAVSGMSLIMTDIGTILNIGNVMIPGLILGIVGILLVCLAYPVYNIVLKKERKRIAPEILRLTDELMK